MNPLKAPCKGCADRHLGCHASCDRYIEYKTEHAKQQTFIRRLDEEDQAFRDYKEAKVKRLRGGKNE